MEEFPDMKGFSYRNLRYIRQWYEFYYQRITIWQQPVAKLGDDNGQQVVAQLDDVNMQQPVAQISEEVFFSVPWGIICISYRNARTLIVRVLLEKDSRKWLEPCGSA